MFPTQKPHVSYSEVRTWKECPFRHKLSYIEKIDLGDPSPYLDYGTLVHEQAESYLNNRTMNLDEFELKLREAWAKHGFDSEEYIQKQADYRAEQGWRPKPHHYIDAWIGWAKTCLEDLPSFMDETFPNWETVSAEEMLYEDIPGHDLKFKGFIDGLIRCDGPGNRRVIWVIDWKTAPPRGWMRDKRRDFSTQAQIALYKSFWRTKNDLPSKDVKCGFVLLKREAKSGKSCELIAVSAGPTVEDKARKLVSSMITGVKRGMFLKNRNSCLFCEYKDTEHCP
jgi:hypothetical protein